MSRETERKILEKKKAEALRANLLKRKERERPKEKT
jgi:hypothetical protein